MKTITNIHRSNRRTANYLAAMILVIFCFGCRTEWELVPVEPLPLDECRDFGSDNLVIKQDARLMMFGYTTRNIGARLDFNNVSRRLQGTGDQPQLTVKVQYDSLKRRSEVSVRAFPGEESMRVYLDNLAETWERNLRYTPFIRNVEFIVLIFPEGLEVKYTRLSEDVAPNPKRKCFTIPMLSREIRYLLPLRNYSATQISLPFNRMRPDAKRQFLNYQQRRRQFIAQFH